MEETVGFFDPEHPLAHVGKKILLAVTILAAVVLYYVERYSKGAQILETLIRIAPLILLGMLALDTLFFIIQGNFMKGIYRTIGVNRPVKYLTFMYLGMNLVNTVAPVVGLSGSIFMMHFEKRRGMSNSETFLINFLYYITDYLVFLGVLLAGLIYLFIVGDVSQTVIFTTLIFVLFIAILCIFGAIAFTYPKLLHLTVRGINSVARIFFFRKKPLIAPDRVNNFAEGSRDVWQRTQKRTTHLVTASGYALLLHLCSMSILWLAFYAFQVPVTIQAVVAGYTIGTLLNTVSITPAGIGFAEGGMTAVFVSLNIPVEQALLVSLLYRTVVIWYPLAAGLVALHVLPTLAGSETEASV